jgi:hypothetical protein
MSLKISEMTATTSAADDDLFVMAQYSSGVNRKITYANLLAALGGYPAGTLFYRALLTQAGTAAPTAIVLQNTLSGDIVWTRLGVGEYKGTLTGAFTDIDKLFLIMGTIGSATAGQLFFNDANSIILNTAGPTTYPVLEDVMLQSTAIQIIVFP